MSEQALKALEHANDELANLLDQAAAIIHLDLSVPLQSDQITPLLPSKSFREAWILRWLLRRLESTFKDYQSTSNAPAVTRLVQDSKLYYLIDYLLSTLPKQQGLEILNERKSLDLLNGVYGAYLAALVHHENASKLSTESHHLQSESRRGAKRRKLSNQGTGSSVKQATIDGIGTIIPVLQSVRVVCRLFAPTRTGPTSSATFSPRIQPRLSIDELGSLIAKVLILTNLALHHEEANGNLDGMSVTDLSISTSQNVEGWLQLWHRQASRRANKSSQIQHNSWNQHCLLPALTLLQSPISKSALKMLEAEIALHTILPLEEKFDKLFSPKWQRDRQRLEWTDIRPTFEALADHLSVLFDQEVIKMPSFAEDHVFALSQLLDVAIRLSSRSDVKARRARRSWLEAFTLCLVYIGYPHFIPEFVNRKGEVLSKPSWSAIAQDTENAEPLLKLIETIRRHDIDFSAHFSQHLYLLAANNNGLKGNVALLASLTRLNAQMFLPLTEAAGTNPLLSTLNDQFSAIGSCSRSVHTTLVSEVLVLIMQAYARARYLDQWVQIWQTNLVDTFFARSNDRSGDSRFDASLIWDSEELFQQFTTSCQAHAPAAFGQIFLEQLLDELRGLPSLRGSSHSTLSKVAIAVALLKSKHSQDAIRIEDKVLLEIAPAAVNALKRNTDYQGQRWRLWDLLGAASSWMPNISDIVSIDDSPVSLLRQGNPWLMVKKGIHQQAQLREVYHAFLFVTDVYEYDLGLSAIFTSCIASLDVAIKELLSNEEHHELAASLTWDGTNLDLDDRQKLLVACLGRLVGIRIIAKMLEAPEGQNLLTQVTLVAMITPTTAASKIVTDQSLSAVSKTIIESSSKLDEVDIVELFVSALKQSKSYAHSVNVPTLLQRQIARGISKSQAKKLLKALQSKEGQKPKDSGAGADFHARKQLINVIAAQHPKLSEEVEESSEKQPLEVADEAEPDAEGANMGNLHQRLQAEAVAVTDRESGDLLNELDTAISIVTKHAQSSPQRREHLIKICILVSSLPTAVFANKPETASSLAELASMSHPSTTTDASELLIHLSLSNIALTGHPALFNQHNIDNLLSSLIFLTSSSSPLILEQDSHINATAIFTHLLEPLLTTARIHRRRLTSRHHLLVLLLQRLIATLFYPPSRHHLSLSSAKAVTHHAAFLATLPPWLNPRTRTSHETLSPNCARLFSRLLQVLCDPSPSAAKHALRRTGKSHAGADNPRRNFELTDPTKILKRQISSYLQPLLISYTQCVLDGYLSPEMKEKLMPGLFAVMNAMDGEVMRAMSVGMMTEAQRDVWRGVWEEWGKYGRWKGK